jgi:c(7)-type cytochrome triheme protein
MNPAGWRRTARLEVVVSSLLFLISASGDAIAFLRPASPAVNVREAPPRGPQAPASDASEAVLPDSHQSRRALELEEVYDRSSPDWPRLQKIEEATRYLPHDSLGFPDWLRALREGKIKLRYDVRGNAKPELLDLDVIMRNTKEMPAVRFPHLAHTQHLACSNCHPAPFRAEKGANGIQMSDIFRGKYCGMCHDRVAFVTFYSCDRCHSVRPDDKGRRLPQN